MNFDLIDDINIMIEEDLDREFSFSDFILDESADPIASSCERGTKREYSQRTISQCVTEDSEDGITDDDRDELNEFLQGIGFLETPRSSMVSVPQLPVAGLSNITRIGYRSAERSDYDMPPLNKRRRVTPLAPPVSLSTANTDPTAAGQPERNHGSKTNKTRTTRQFVPFEEMQRLMAVYGPIKAPRKSKCCCIAGKNAKPDSIRRKFYRWFTDFEDRFVANPDGVTYRPLAGHEEEIKYRECMRNMDLEVLVHKRKIGRRN